MTCRRRRNTPIEMDRNPIAVRGEPLDQILWRGRQWAVTTYGIECLDGTYPIAADRLLEDVMSEWGGQPYHMCEKEWVDSDDFLTAWLVGMSLHGVVGNTDDVRRCITKSSIKVGE